MSSIAQNIARVQAEINAACERSGRDPQTVTLIGVSKTKPVEQILEAIDAGLQHFGENRVEESNEKIPKVNAQTETHPQWHMIGHVQSRKVKDLFLSGTSGLSPLFDLIHSVDSIKLAGKFSKQAEEAGIKLNILLQMNVSGEESKEGFDAVNWAIDSEVRARVWQEFSTIRGMAGLNICGLMTIAPIVDEMEAARPVFVSLRQLRDALSESFGVALTELSMGMTDDYPVAVEEGATLVRVGRAIFGERS
jgi:PLP dependent protein